ncbi:winged helix-turn-helix domain-containing protein [Ideonella sp. DXS29W]|uniref:Winged helix-turn-helix domain-containing protein n=1 Tax=Ideonella lacteola TaxID=2984193 RepID=A0ABU9BV20_9BURK
MESPAYSYRFGTAEFDESRMELRVGCLPIDVEPRALEVLHYLLRHAGEVVTKEELLREVWSGRVTVDKVLSNAINKLRRALGESNSNLIATQARIGYRLDGAVTRTAVGRQPLSRLDLKAGHPVPGRTNFVLHQQLGRTQAHEVWLAEHAKTRELRVYKFALDADHLRSLKREVTLLRVLQEGLADTSHVVEVLDWNFEWPPYFLECRYGGLNLAQWAGRHLQTMEATQRVALFLQIVDVVAAAHSVGVLHKDLKPGNILVSGDATQAHVRLSDFGSGRLLEPERLAQFGITRLGMTVEDAVSPDNSSGTPLYLAPELFAGQSPTVKSDVYALGILLYQLLTGRIGQPMAPGWAKEIDDELLREDLQSATEANPDQRLAHASELSRRLHRLDQRRAELAERRRADETAQQLRESLSRARARRPIVFALFAVLVVGLLVYAWLWRQAEASKLRAQDELRRANALSRFLNEDLIGRSNPLVSAKGPDTTLREVLTVARDRVPARFADQPGTQAAIHGSLAQMFSAIDLFRDAEEQARQALEQAQRDDGATSEATLQAQSVLVRALSRLGRLDDAEHQLRLLEQSTARSSTPAALQRLAAARSTWYIAKGQFGDAAAALRLAIEGIDPGDLDQMASRDTLRLDLITTLSLAGQREQARAEGKRLLEEAQARSGNNELLMALARLAQVRAVGNDHDEAERLLLQAQPVIVAQLGDNHSRHLQLLGELLGVAFRRGDWPRATQYAQQVHERVRSKLGDGHALTYVSLVNWARTLDEAGQAETALQKARTGYERLREMAGPRSPQTHDAAFVLALIELELGHIASAQTLIDELDPSILESGRATGQWPDAINALKGISLAQRGKGMEAKALLDSALEALGRDGGVEKPDRLYLEAAKARKHLK